MIILNWKKWRMTGKNNIWKDMDKKQAAKNVFQVQGTEQERRRCS